jgi:hypothetical protein
MMTGSPFPVPETNPSALKRPNTTRSVDVLALAIFFVVAGVLTFVFALLAYSLYFQHANYAAAITEALKGSSAQHSSAITYLRAWDFAVVKMSALFLAFALAFLGALYVLRTNETAYAANAESSGFKAKLETSSPGLVMVTLGVVLVVCVMYARTTIEFVPPSANADSGVVTKPISQAQDPVIPQTPKRLIPETPKP